MTSILTPKGRRELRRDEAREGKVKRPQFTVKLMLFLPAIVLALAAARPAMAEDTGARQYVSLKLGAYFPQHDDTEDFDAGFNVETYYGRYFHKNYASELGIGFFKSDGEIKTATGSLDATLDVVDIVYTIKGVYPVGKLELFLGPGIGLYFAKSNFTVASGTVTTNAESDWNTGFGLHVLAGANYNFRADWFLGLEGKYLFAKTKDSIIPEGDASGSHLDGVVASAVLGWRF
jgi:opacity protein-like surface antigen